MIRSELLFSTFIKGQPKGQPRPRAFSRGGKAAVYDPGTAEGWKSSVALACRDIEGAAMDKPLMVSLIFRMPRPKSHIGKTGLLARFLGVLFTKKPDADNLAKAVLDALTLIGAWKDDDQITDLIIRKRFIESETHPTGCAIEIHQLIETP